MSTLSLRSASAASRRVKFGLMSLVVLSAAFVSFVLLNVLASRFAMRSDTTASGEHQLAPRTKALLATLDGPYQVVVAAEMSHLDPRAVERVKDVLDQMARASTNVQPVWINTGSESGSEEYHRLLASLAERDKSRIDSQTAAVAKAAAAMTALADAFEERLATGLRSVRDSIPDTASGADKNRAFFDQRGAAAANTARDLRAGADLAGKALNAQLGPIALPGTDKAATAIKDALAPAVEQLSLLERSLRLVMERPEMPQPVKDAARGLLAQVTPLRDSAAIELDAINRLGILDLLRVAQAVRSSECLLVIGPEGKGLTAIDFGAIFPSSDWLDASGVQRADLRRRAEELLATSLASLARPIKPIVVFVHGESRAFMLKAPFVQRLTERMRQRGIDVLEWCAALEPEPPATTPLDPSGTRPVVFVNLNLDTGGKTGTGEESAARRAELLGQALEKAADSGKPVLLSINPSLLPTYGSPDPTTSVMTRFGVTADSGRPLMREVISAQGRIVDTAITAQAGPTENPISTAIRGLPTLFPWAVPLETSAPPENSRATVKTWPLYTQPGSNAVWGESQWRAMWERAPAERPLISDQFAFDGSRDRRESMWTLAVAAERTDDKTGQKLRMVAVGSNAWYTDPITQRVSSAVDGRIAPQYPGNAELFEACVAWLAGQDDLIAQSPSARAVPLIEQLSESKVRWLRIVVIGLVPMLVLVAGVAFRVARG